MQFQNSIPISMSEDTGVSRRRQGGFCSMTYNRTTHLVLLIILTILYGLATIGSILNGEGLSRNVISNGILLICSIIFIVLWYKRGSDQVGGVSTKFLFYSILSEMIVFLIIIILYIIGLIMIVIALIGLVALKEKGYQQNIVMLIIVCIIAIILGLLILFLMVMVEVKCFEVITVQKKSLAEKEEVYNAVVGKVSTYLDSDQRWCC